jgi:hypothetical protein
VVAGVIAEKVKATDGRISAKRLLPVARAAGYAQVDLVVAAADFADQAAPPRLVVQIRRSQRWRR